MDKTSSVKSGESAIAITGIGILSPNAIGKDNFQLALKRGISGVKNIRLFDTSGLNCKTGGEVTDFNAEELLGKKGLRNLNRSTKLALSASMLAFMDAGLEYPVSEDVSGSFGVSLGTATGSMQSIIDFDRDILRNGPVFTNPALFPNTVLNASASHISIRFNIKGFNSTVTSSLCSGMDSIFYAVNMLKNYNYDIALAGGVDEMCMEAFFGFYKSGFLSGSVPGSKEFISAPYDKRRNGAIFSEGSCILVLEKLEHAVKRSARIYAKIAGYGNAFDPKSRLRCNLRGNGASMAISKALECACLKGRDIDAIFGYANSSPDGDLMEAKAISNVFGAFSVEIPVTSIKSMIGEPISAGGAFNCASAAICIKEGFMPATINYSMPDKRCSLNIIKDNPLNMRMDNVLINAFSPTGSNSSLIMSKCN
jgi:3-oxoacyl-[acyl-carrier-protein] synthase II